MEPDRTPRILVVEDEPETAEVLKGLLELKNSAEVETTGSIRGARERIASSGFDLVTVDHKLPDGSGLDLLSELTSSGSRLPVIVVTGRGDEEVAAAAFQRGASGYVVKNDRLATALPEAVERALRDFVLMKAVEAVRESESFYHTLFNEATDPLFIETPDGEIEEVNLAATLMLGYTHDELVGKSALDLIPPARRREFEDAVATLVAGEAIEFENITKSGALIPVEVIAKEVMTRRGTRYVIVARDLTERKRTRKALENERAFKEDALNVIPDIFVVANLEGSFYKWNESFREVTGYSDEEIDAMRTFEFFSPEDYMQMMAAVEGVAQTGLSQTIELSLVAKDGRRLPYEFTGSLMRDSDGNPLGIAGTGRNITDRKRAEEALRNVIKETNERREEITALLESTRLVLEHKEFRKAAREIFDLCWKLVGAEAGFVAVLEEGGGGLILVEPEELRERFEEAVSMPISRIGTPAFKSGKAFYENDFRTSELADMITSEQHLAIESILIAPLLVEGEPAGMMGLANKPGGFTGRDALMASAFGEVASVAYRDSKTMQLLRSSEERFRSVAETAMEAIICADSDVNIDFWNRGAENIFGYKAEEMLGRPLTSILPERERKARLESMMRELSGGSAGGRIFELPGLKKDGTEFSMELSRSTWKSATGEPNFALIVRDVTVRKQAEAILKDSEELYRTLLHTSPDAVVIFDLKGKLVDLSQRAVELYGFSEASEAQGADALDYIAQSDRAKAVEAIERELKGEVPRNLELNMVRSDGVEFVAEVSGSCIRDGEGRPWGFINIIRDITERKRAEHELLVLNQELEGYAHLVSHDLKGPLGSMMAASLALRGLLKSEWDDQTVEGALDLVNIMESSVRKSTVLIDDLLELAEAGQKPYDVNAVDITALVARILGDKEGDPRAARLKVRLDPDLGSVVANETHMYLLFSNLITNAIKHNKARKPELAIGYSERGEDGLHRFLVRDNGPGIDPADIEKIFLPFFTGETGETGIGLATVAKIIELYGGTIRAYNDGGACFEFTLRDYS